MVERNRIARGGSKWTVFQVKRLIDYYFVQQRSMTYIANVCGRSTHEVYLLLNTLQSVKSAKPAFSSFGFDEISISPSEEKFALLEYAKTAGPIIRDIIKQRLETLNYES